MLDLMTAAEIGVILKIAPRTASRRLDAAGVPSLRIGGKLRRWRRSAVVAFLAASESGAASTVRAAGRAAWPASFLTDASGAPGGDKAAAAQRVTQLLGVSPTKKVR